MHGLDRWRRELGELFQEELFADLGGHLRGFV